MPWTHFPTLAQYNAFKGKLQVAKWPRDNTTRTDCNFRMSLGEGLPFPRPQRFLLHLRGVPDEPMGFAYPVIDMDVSGPFHLHGTSGVNEFGREVELDIVEHLEADFPGSDWNGIEYHFKFKMVGFDDWDTTFFYESGNPTGVPCEIPMKADYLTTTCPVVLVIVNPDTLDLDWPTTPAGANWEFRPMSACYVFPEEAPPLGMAEFNGTDAYIALDHNLVSTNQDFIIEAELRLKELDHFWPLMGIEGTGGFLGMDDDDFIFGNLRLATSWTPTVDEWFTWRLEFEQPLQLKYKLFIDDIEVMDRTTNRQNLAFNRLGVYRHGVSGTIWANMDMRSLKFWTGDQPSTIVALDMPCDTDACDIGPDENHGTTFNMTLPSC